jgi:hypothetical protein
VTALERRNRELERRHLALVTALTRSEERIEQLSAELEHALRRESLLERIVYAFTGDRRQAERHEVRHGRHG